MDYDFTKFREITYSGEAIYKCKLYIEDELIDPRQIAKITISNPIIDTQSQTFYVGSFISQQIIVKFKNLNGLNIQSNLRVDLDIGLMVDDEEKIIHVGKFLIDALAENYQTTCEITCLDYAIKMKPNINYKPVFVNEKAKIDDILVWICNYFGVELGTYPKTNGDLEVGTYDETISGKQWISYIAEIKGCNAKFDGQGVLHLIPLKNGSTSSKQGKFPMDLDFERNQDISLVINGKSEQETTKGNQLIDFNNPLSASGDTQHSFINDVLTVSSEGTSGSYSNIRWNITDLIINNAGKTLKFGFESYDFSQGKTPIIQMNVKKGSESLWHTLLKKDGTIDNFSIPNDTSDITSVSFQIHSSNQSQTVVSRITITKPLLYFDNNNIYEKYTGGQPSPNPDYPSEIKSSGKYNETTGKYEIDVEIIGKNKFNYIDKFLPTNGTLTNKINPDGSITISGKPPIAYAGIVSRHNIDNILENGETYTVSEKNYYKEVFLEIRGQNKTDGSYIYHQRNKTFVVDLDNYTYTATLICGTLANWGDEVKTITNFWQLEKGDTATEFEPFKSNKHKIELDEPLRSLPNGVKDVVYTENGKLYVKRKVGKHIFNGNEDWYGGKYSTHNDNYVYLYNEDCDNLVIKGQSSSISTHFKTFERILGIGSAISSDCFTIGAHDRFSLRLMIDKSKLSNLTNETSRISSFKTWLSQNNVEVLYELAEPTVEEIGKIGQILVYKGKNTVYATSNIKVDGTTNWLSPHVKINALKSKSWVLGEKYEISGVTYYDATRNFSFGGSEENILMIRQDNPFIRDIEVVENIYNSVVGTVIWNLTTENYGDISLLPYYYIDYVLGENHYYTLNNFTLTYEMNVMSKVDVKLPSKQQQATTNNMGVSINDIKKIQSLVDLINAQINIIATDTQTIKETVDKNNKDINENLSENYYTTQQVEELIINAESGLTNVYSQAGGNNILRNTGFWFEEENGYEFWNGTAIRNTNNNSVNGYSITLQSGSLWQDISVTNGEYTVSFTYENLNELANTKVIINGKTFELNGKGKNSFQTGQKDSDGNYITDPIIVNDNHLKIDFVTDTNNSCEIYDIMCNIGNVKAVYSQNQNETTTDTVNISKGITITSSTSDVKFTANNDGIRTKNKLDEVITDFTDKGMNTKEAVITDEAEIVKTLWQEVDDQTWITRM